MNNLTLSLLSIILIGLGATLTTDLWALFLKRAFKITSPNLLSTSLGWQSKRDLANWRRAKKVKGAIVAGERQGNLCHGLLTH